MGGKWDVSIVGIRIGRAGCWKITLSGGGEVKA